LHENPDSDLTYRPVFKVSCRYLYIAFIFLSLFRWEGPLKGEETFYRGNSFAVFAGRTWSSYELNTEHLIVSFYSVKKNKIKLNDAKDNCRT
jgi:hypothetical protein